MKFVLFDKGGFIHGDDRNSNCVYNYVLCGAGAFAAIKNPEDGLGKEFMSGLHAVGICLCLQQELWHPFHI